MSIINNGLLLASGADAAVGYQISRSLRFNSADSAYLSRTPGSAGNRRTWTFSCWIKRAKLGEFTSIIVCMDSGASHYFQFVFETDDTLSVYDTNVAGSTKALQTSRVFRDVSAWYHLVLYYNTTQSTAANKAKLYVNGVEETAFSTDNRSSLTADSSMNRAEQHSIGSRQPYSGSYLNAYLADIYFLDGTATTPSTFAETDATTGQWVPKTPTGISYGTNGFRLTFSDNSGTTSTTLGKDAAGSNNWSPNNFSVASGSGNDSLVDSPSSYGTDTGAGSEVRGNYCVLNPLDNGGLTLSNGNLDFSRSTTSWVSARSTFAVSSGKWYWEITLATGTDCMAGISKNDVALSSYFGIAANGWAYHSQNGRKYNNGSDSAYGNSWTGGNDIVGVAFDADAGSISFYKNGVIQNSGTAAFTGLTNGPYFPSVALYGTCTAFINFGQRAFAYTAPSGFKALCDTNLTAPTIAKPNTVMDIALYSGTDATKSITFSSGLSPDLVWIKCRSVATSNGLFDVVRGTNKGLFTNNTLAEQTYTSVLTSFDSSGFTLGSDDWTGANETGNTYVAWCFDGGSSNSTNTSGTITSTVRANATAGFSIVTYTGNGSSGATIGHSLGVAPSLILVKCRSNAAGWLVYHSSIGATKYLALESTAAAGTYSGAWNDTAPTSTVFSVGNDNSVNTSTRTYVAYCFSPLVGYSSAFSWSGTGSTDGPAIYLGFRPKLIIWKRTDSAANWAILDSSRSSYNVADDWLGPNSSIAEAADNAAYAMDFLSNGLKIRATHEATNQSGGTYIGFAWAESPFQYARAR